MNHTDMARLRATYVSTLTSMGVPEDDAHRMAERRIDEIVDHVTDHGMAAGLAYAGRLGEKDGLEWKALEERRKAEERNRAQDLLRHETGHSQEF